jgi:uncharacterized LabA/DUF88 family protein
MNIFDPREKLAFFIDGVNLYQTARALNFDIDYKRLLQDFKGEAYLMRAYYYTALAEDQEFSSIRPLIDWLDYNGYRVVTKPMKEYTDSNGQRRRSRPSLEIELAVDAFEVADAIDHVVLFTGDGNYRSLVLGLQKKGLKVSVISTLKTNPPMVSDELRRLADHFIELNTLGNIIGRDPSERPAKYDDDYEDDEDEDY